MIFLRQSTASQEIPLGRFVDSTDGNTEETALTIANTDIKIWKTGATTLANKNSGGATHIANGEYYCVLDATDTDTIGPMKVTVHVAGALYVQVYCTVLDEAVYDVLFGTTALATATNITAAAGCAVSSIGAGVITAASIATDAIDADAIAADAGAEIGTAVWASATRTLTGSVTVGTWGVNTLPLIADAVWNATVGVYGSSSSYGALLETQLDAAVSSRSTLTQTQVTGGTYALNSASFAFNAALDFTTTQKAATLARVTLVDTTTTNTDMITAAGIRTAVGLASANLDTQLTAIDDYLDTELAAVKSTTDKLELMIEADTGTGGDYQFNVYAVDRVWDAVLTRHLTSGTTGAALNAAGAAGDPWSTSLPGAYGAGTAGYIVGTNLDTTTSSRASQTSLDTVDDLLDTEVAAIKAKTDQLTFTVANRVDSTTQSGVSTLDAAGIRTAVGLASANLDTQLTAIDDYLDTEVSALTTELAKVPKSDGTATWNATALAAIQSECNDALTATVADSVPADGTRPSVAQAVYMIAQYLFEKSISGTTMTVRKPDGSTALFTLTLNDATSPTSLTRAM